MGDSPADDHEDATVHWDVHPDGSFRRQSRGHTAKVTTGSFTFPAHPLIPVKDTSYRVPNPGSFHHYKFNNTHTTQHTKQDSMNNTYYPDGMANNDTTSSSSIPVSMVIHRITLGTLGMVWVLFAAFTLLALHQMCKPRYRQRKKMATVRSYLHRFDDKDIKVFKSPPGGFNVLYNRKRLVNRLRYYWTGELPDQEDASTILFEPDMESQRDENEEGQPRQFSSCWSFSCTDDHMDLESWPRTVVSSLLPHQDTSDESSMASNSVYTNGNYTNQKPKMETKQRRIQKVEKNIVHVLQKSTLPLADVRLDRSAVSEDGFSVTYRCAEDDPRSQYGEEVIDFGTIDSGRGTRHKSTKRAFPELDRLHGDDQYSLSSGDDAGDEGYDDFW